jgi:hypothetical protein
MLNKISGLARALYIVLAIVTGFVALSMMDVALVLVVLGLIAGISMPRERMVLAAATVIALPIVGTTLGHIPAIGGQLNAVAGNLQLGVAGAFASALAIMLYHLVMDIGFGSAARRGGAFFFRPPIGLVQERAVLTSALARAGSIDPPSLSFTSAMTRPMSFMLVAPVSATISRIFASASAAPNCCGRKRSMTAISASSIWARSSRPFLR